MINNSKNNLMFFLIIFLTPIIIKSQQPDCRWDFYFVTQPNQIFGIWPTEGRWANIDSLKSLRLKYGFNKIFVQKTNVDNALSAGYKAEDLMVSVEPSGFGQDYTLVLADPRLHNVFGYYCDEPAYYDRTGGTIQLWQLSVMNIDLHYQIPNCKFIISDFHSPSKGDLFWNYSSSADQVMCSSYTDGGFLGIFPVADQRPKWDEFIDIYTWKFKMTWIGAHADLSQYPYLLGYTWNKQLGVWLYQYQQSPDDNQNIYQYCMNSSMPDRGYIKKCNQMLKYKYVNGTIVKKLNWGPPHEGKASITQLSNGNNLYDNASMQWYLQNLNTNYYISDKIIDNERIDDYYSNHDIIASNFIVPNNKHASLNSETKIVLEPGFHANNGSQFVAYIHDGINGNSYNIACSNSSKIALDKLNNLLSKTNSKNNQLNLAKEIPIPDHFDLSQNYPNPFNPTTIIKYAIPNSGDVKLIVYDIMGKEVKTLVNEFKAPGYYQVQFNASDFSSGIYFYRLVTNNFSAIKKLVVIK